MRAAVLIAALVAAGCNVPAKSLPDGGDGVVDAGADPDGGPGDREAPETTITAGPDELSSSTAATFEFTADEPATFTCRFDGDAPFDCDSPLTRTFADAAHTFSVRATDLAGNQDETPAEQVWTIDTVAPETTITMAPPAADNSVTVAFEFVASDAGASFDCSIDGATYQACTSGDQVGPLDDGAHSFAVRARDAAGNLDSSPAIHAWAIDSSTPDTQILTGPAGATADTGATFTFVSPDAGSGATYQCNLDGAGFVACTSPRNHAGLAEGEHTFAVRVRDAVGNLDPTPATRSWTVDLTPPDTTIESGPSGAVPLASASFSYTASEEGATYQCSLDGGAWAACANPTTLSALGQGEHTLSVRAVDPAGNLDATPAQQTWTVDTVAPVITITSGPAPSSTAGPYASFGFTVSEGTPSCSLDGGTFAACTSPAAYSLPAGAHSFAVQAGDAAGNLTTTTRGWTVACAPPAAAGAAGLFHLDEVSGQTATNAAGGADALLGADATVEAEDPARVAAARFGGGLGLNPAEADRLTWSAALGAVTAHTVELWIRPAAGAGTQALVASGDGRIVLEVLAGGSSAEVRYTLGDGGASVAVTSAGMTVGQWHHVVASFDATTMRLWLDGVRVEAPGIAPGAGFAGDSFVLGGGFGGDLDELYVAGTAIASDDAALPRYCPP